MPSKQFEVKTKVAIGHNSQQYVADLIMSLTHGVIALDGLGFEINYLVISNGVKRLGKKCEKSKYTITTLLIIQYRYGNYVLQRHCYS